MLESLLEPIQSHKYNGGIYEDRVGDGCDEHHGDLLVEEHLVEIDGVQSRLGGRACSEEDGIDVWDKTRTVDDY